MHQDHNEGQSSVDVMRQYQYVRPLGRHRPHFEGIPDEYYPLSACQVIKYSIFVLSVIVGVLGIMIGFLYWVLAKGLRDFIIIWSIVFIFFILVMIVLFYVGGRNRIKQQKRLIQEQQKKYAKLQNISNKKKLQLSIIEQ